MSGLGNIVVLGALMGMGAIGAVITVFSREVLRVAIALGLLLLVVAGIFLYYLAPLVAIAQVFVYAGGVLVLLLFALMLLQRDAGGRLVLKQNHDVGAAVVAVAVFILVSVGYGTAVAPGLPKGAPVERIAYALLGPYLPQFEALALLLLVALVGAVAIVTPAGEPAGESDAAIGAGPGGGAAASEDHVAEAGPEDGVPAAAATPAGAEDGEPS